MHDLAQDRLSKIQRHLNEADKHFKTRVVIPSRSGKTKDKYIFEKHRGKWVSVAW